MLALTWMRQWKVVHSKAIWGWNLWEFPKELMRGSGEIEEQEMVPNICPEPAERGLACPNPKGPLFLWSPWEIFRSLELEKQALSKVAICEVPASYNLVLLCTEKSENWNNLVISLDPSFSTGWNSVPKEHSVITSRLFTWAPNFHNWILD